MNEEQEFVLQAALGFVAKQDLNSLLYPPQRQFVLETAVKVGVELLAEMKKQLGQKA